MKVKTMRLEDEKMQVALKCIKMSLVALEKDEVRKVAVRMMNKQLFLAPNNLS